MAASPKLPLWLRWMGLGAGILTLVWLPVEDSRITNISILGFIWAMWLSAWIMARPSWSDWFSAPWLRPVVFSGVMGLAAYPTALLLNILKTGLHGHGFLDLSLFQLRWVLLLSPLWIILGGIFGWFTTGRKFPGRN